MTLAVIYWVQVQLLELSEESEEELELEDDDEDEESDEDEEDEESESVHSLLLRSLYEDDDCEVDRLRGRRLWRRGTLQRSSWWSWWQPSRHWQ